MGLNTGSGERPPRDRPFLEGSTFSVGPSRGTFSKSRTVGCGLFPEQNGPQTHDQNIDTINSAPRTLSASRSKFGERIWPLFDSGPRTRMSKIVTPSEKTVPEPVSHKKNLALGGGFRLTPYCKYSTGSTSTFTGSWGKET